MRPWRRAAAATAVSAAAVGGFLGIGGSTADAQLTTFTVTASADGVRKTVDVPGAPLTSTVSDAGSPTAQVVVNGLGESRGFAAMPYPGELVVSGPSLIFPLIGLPTPPDYPLMASSEYPARPTSTVARGEVRLRADSAERSSQADASANGGSGADGAGRLRAKADGVVDDTRHEVTGTARSTAESATFGGVFRIGRVDASATVRRGPTGPPTMSSTFVADGVTVAGLTVGVTPEGLVLPGALAPVPDTSGRNAVLDNAGMSVQYLAPERTDDGIVSAGLAVTVRTPTPSGQDARTTYTFGRARAAVSVSAAEPTIPDFDVLPPDPVFGPVDPVAPAPAVDAAPIAPVTTPRTAPPRLAVAERPPARPPFTLSMTTFYLVLVVGAAVAAAGTALARRLRVRLAWTS